MNCPLCTSALLVHDAGEVELDRCAGCGAVYFDAGELSVSLGGARSDEQSVVLAPTLDGGVGLPCPRDGETMREVQVTTSGGGEIDGPKAVIQVCPRCKGVLMSRMAVELSRAHGVKGADVPTRNPDRGVPERLLDIAMGALELVFIWA